ncbi:MAG: hypothetical protein KGM91_08275 [Burkholderiales bacterium]|nr:hypothetical protein [Burkholderiales bacterium]
MRPLALLVESGAPLAAVSGRLDLVASWLRHLPGAQIESNPHLLYWSGTSMALKRPADAHALLLRAFEQLRDGPDRSWSLLAWAGLVDAIFLLYRDLRELDPLIEWMNAERDASVDRMPRPLRSLVVGSALFALPFRQPRHPRIPAWRERAERLVEHNPTSDLGVRLAAGLSFEYLWSGNLPAAEIVSTRFAARATGKTLSPVGAVISRLNEATLRLHQGRLDECAAAVHAGLAAARQHGIRAWDGILRCHAAAACLSRERVDEARSQLAAIEALFAEGIPADEAYYRAMLLWCDFVGGVRIGAVARCESAIEITDAKGVPYFMGVARIASALVVHEAGHPERGRALLDAGLALARDPANPLLLWIGGLFAAHIHYAAGDAARGDAELKAALQLGCDRALVHFFCWPRRIVARLVDRALERGYCTDYVARLISLHAMKAGEAPTRSERWDFSVRIHLFGDARIVHADGQVEPLSPQFLRQIELLAVLVERQGKPTPLGAFAAALYAGEGVDPIASVKRILHSLRSRLGQVVVQRNASLALDFEKVWIDACSFQQLQREAASSAELEAWLDRYYAGPLLERVEHSGVVSRLRRRIAESAERAIADVQGQRLREQDDAALQRLQARWRPHFPAAFDPPAP